MNFKLNTTKKSAEVAGQYTGRVIYNASVGDKNGGTTSGGSGSTGGTTEGGNPGSSGGTVTTPSELKTLDIEGTKYVVLEERENNQALVMTTSSIGDKKFQSTARADGQNKNTYEGSEIDNYLENDWYNSLSSTMKAAIQTTSIKQASYDRLDKLETGYKGQVYNTISRHAFLPSVDKIGKVVDLKNPDKVKAFLNGTSIWTRDSYQGNDNDAECLNADYGSSSISNVDNTIGVRPAFVIDLSQVNHSVVK